MTDLNALEAAQIAAIRAAFVTSESGKGSYKVVMKVPDIKTLHNLHDAILILRRQTCAGQ